MKRSHLVLLSVYLYNEYRGFTQLERLRDAFKKIYPLETEMIAAIDQHAADEKRHFLMFKRLFSQANQMPLRVGHGVGYVDRFLMTAFGKSADQISLSEIAANHEMLHRLFRVIMMTEARGLRQVQRLLGMKWIKKTPNIAAVFRVIEGDEPSHAAPYESWLAKRNAHTPGIREQLEDLWIHVSLTWVRIPFLYLTLWHPRLSSLPGFK